VDLSATLRFELPMRLQGAQGAGLWQVHLAASKSPAKVWPAKSSDTLPAMWPLPTVVSAAW
jgi:hypothetical protein